MNLYGNVALRVADTITDFSVAPFPGYGGKRIDHLVERIQDLFTTNGASCVSVSQIFHKLTEVQEPQL